MRKTVFAMAAAALVLAAVPASARSTGSASRAELQAVEAQMQAQIDALAARLDGLVTANGALRSENEQLRAEMDRREAEVDYLKSQTRELREEGAVAAAEIDKVKGADWASRIRFKGDLRLRDDHTRTERVAGSGPTAEVEEAAQRNRMRFRARFSAEAKVTDHSKVVLGLASGDGDPRSTNQTFTNTASTKSVYIDQAYADWAFAPGARLVLGKYKQVFWRPANSLFFDTDLNPEGGAVAFERGMLFGSAYGWWVQEGYNANPQGNNEDANILGAQLGLKFALLGGETRVAAHYYDCGACQYNNPYWGGGNAYGNTTVPQDSGGSTVQVLRYDYDVVALAAELNTKLFNLPFQVWADWARNVAPDVEYDTAYAMGVYLGKAASPGTWEGGFVYQSMDKDAMFAQLIDSDFAAGNTDGDGWGFQFGYAPVKNIVLNAQYYINSLNKDVAPVSGPGYEVGKGLDYDRWRLDVNYRF